jgi:curli biogenesis system outer membrane secretion channel CsgG
VFPFFNGGSYGSAREDFEPLRVGLQQWLMHELAQNSNLRVVDRSILREIVEEQRLGASGQVDDGTAARVGRIVGARYVVVGGFIDLFGEFQLDGRIVSVETSELVSSAQVRSPRENLSRLVGELAARVTAGVQLPPLPQALREARDTKALPLDGLTRHANILQIRDRGEKERAIGLYRQLIRDYPQVEEQLQAELRELTGPPAGLYVASWRAAPPRQASRSTP